MKIVSRFVFIFLLVLCTGFLFAECPNFNGDSAQCLQQMLDDAKTNGNKIVELSGVYKIYSGIIVPESVTLRGCGSEMGSVIEVMFGKNMLYDDWQHATALALSRLLLR